MKKITANLIFTVLIFATNISLIAQFDPPPVGLKQLWKIPAYFSFDEIRIVRQTDEGAVFLNAQWSNGATGIWIDSKGNPIYMKEWNSYGYKNIDILYFSDSRIIFIEGLNADGKLEDSIVGAINKKITITEVTRIGSTAQTNLSTLTDNIFIPTYYNTQIVPKERIILRLASNQEWSPYRWLYAYSTESDVGINKYIKIRNNPADQYSPTGGSADFSVDVAASIPITYQWQKNGLDLINIFSTGKTLSLSNLTQNDSGVYSLIAKSVFGNVTSSPAKLTIVSLPTITQKTNYIDKNSGLITTLAPNIISEGPTLFQWFKNDLLIPGETNSIINVDKYNKADRYQIECKNMAGKVLSDPVQYRISNGSKIWQFKEEENNSFRAYAALDSEGSVFLVSEKTVYSINGDTGVVNWKYKSSDSNYSSPSVSNDGTLYVGGYNSVYALDAKTSFKKWEFLGNDKFYNCPAIGSDGTIYVGAQNKVYALAVEQSNENYRIIKDKYDNSLANTNDLLEADVQKLQSKINLALCQADIALKYYQLQFASGKLINSFNLSTTK